MRQHACSRIHKANRHACTLCRRPACSVLGFVQAKAQGSWRIRCGKPCLADALVVTTSVYQVIANQRLQTHSSSYLRVVKSRSCRQPAKTFQKQTTVKKTNTSQKNKHQQNPQNWLGPVHSIFYTTCCYQTHSMQLCIMLDLHHIGHIRAQAHHTIPLE